MNTGTATSSTQREPALLGQTVVVIGGSGGMGMETGRQARAEGAKLILIGRDPARLESAARELDAMSTAAFDVTDFPRLAKFFDDLPAPVDHVMVTGPGPHSISTSLTGSCRQQRSVPSAHPATSRAPSGWNARAVAGAPAGASRAVSTSRFASAAATRTSWSAAWRSVVPAANAARCTT